MDKRKRVSTAETFNVERLEEVWTVKDLATYLRCHVSTIYRLVSRGEMPHFRIGSDIRFRRSQIEKWLEKQSHPGT